MEKRKIVFCFTFFMLFSLVTYAQYPIPSYKVEVNGRALFEEMTTHKGKKDGNVKIQCNTVAEAGCPVRVYFFTLDRTTVLGPYCVSCGETLTIPLDEREWGVYVESEIIVTVDVWFSDPGHAAGYNIEFTPTEMPEPLNTLTTYPLEIFREDLYITNSCFTKNI